jgi:hypothetical protein
VEEIRHTTIEMPDGARLAARIWLPRAARSAPVPAILEYIPYRKNDVTAARDSLMHPYFAGHGYASIRVDLRGSGESEGLLTDEYLQTELDDGVTVLRWIAAQDWCTGDVGMIGISWGGFNGLQIAAMRPPELKAVVSVCSTDDRYADDVHYMGGCMLGDNISWAAQMFAFNAMPPDPALVGDAWREMWLARLEANEPWLLNWMEHQHRDDYWRHGSICEDWSAVTIPVMAVSGWADGYSNAVFRLLANLQGPKMGLVGPWSHKYPHIGMPGPAIGFLQECLRWWDNWLKGVESGIMSEPVLRAWMQHPSPPVPRAVSAKPGRWIGEATWPSPRIEERRFRLDPGYRLLPENTTDGLADEVNPGGKPFISVKSPLSTGLFAGKWCSYAATPDLPHDQRQEDGGALVFNSDRLEEDVEILGAPVLDLAYAVDKPVAMVAVRISEVDEDDRATRITYGVRNLTHDENHADPRPINPGEHRTVRIALNDIAQRFAKGHRIRVAISTSYWPLAWPSPEHVKLKVFTGECRLTLPIRPPDPKDADVTFEDPEAARPYDVTQIGTEDHNWHVVFDLAEDRHTLVVTDDSGLVYLPDSELVYGDRVVETYSSVADDFESIAAQTHAQRSLERGEWRIAMDTRMSVTSDKDNFYLDAELDAWEGSTRIFSRNWSRSIPRRCV